MFVVFMIRFSVFTFFLFVGPLVSPIACVRQLFQRKNPYDLVDGKYAIQTTGPRGIHFLPEREQEVIDINAKYAQFLVMYILCSVHFYIVAENG